MSHRVGRFLLFILLCLPSSAKANLERLKTPHELNLRLVPTSDEPIDELGVKTIHVVEGRLGIDARWSSQIHKETTDQPWPEFKVLLREGWIQSDNWREATSLLHPHFWAQGYYRLDQNGLLWVSPELLSLGKNKRKELEPGILTDSLEHFSKGPARLMEIVAGFRDTLKPFRENTIIPGPLLGQKDIDTIKQFVEDFMTVKIKSRRLDYSLVVDGAKNSVPVVLVGNATVDYTILDYATNPLVLSLNFSATRAPALLKPALDYFTANLGYKITQISTN